MHAHSKAPQYGANQGKIYMVMMDTARPALRKFNTFLDTAKMPEGTAEGIATSGKSIFIYIISATSYMFFRFCPLGGGRLRHHERHERRRYRGVQCTYRLAYSGVSITIYFVNILLRACRACFDPNDVAELWAVQKEILGPDEKRSPEMPKWNDFTPTGGTAWERSRLCKPIENAKRCSTLGYSYQVPRSLTAPSPGARVNGGILDPHQIVRKRTVEVRV